MNGIDFLQYATSMKNLVLSKLRAGSIHLLISLVIFLILVAVIYFIWYPQPYFFTAGGWHGVKIAGAINLALGPLLTLIIFNPAKRRIAFIVVTE